MTLRLVDSHCHLNFAPLAEDIDGELAAAREAGVAHLLAIAVDLEHYPEVLALAEGHAEISASVGVHPNSREGEEPDVERLVALGGHPQVVAIGETGLDYFRSEGDLDWQRARFERHIAAARALGKPLVVHTREAAADTLDLLRACEASDCGGVIHCFTEDWPFARAVLDLGFYVSFSGIVTFKSARQVQDVARKVPADRYLVETDAPYLAPVPHRGKPNRPAWVRHVAEFVAGLRGEPLATVAEQTTANFQRLFGVAV